jgi:hypothetical protein
LAEEAWLSVSSALRPHGHAPDQERLFDRSIGLPALWNRGSYQPTHAARGPSQPRPPSNQLAPAHPPGAFPTLSCAMSSSTSRSPSPVATSTAIQPELDSTADGMLTQRDGKTIRARNVEDQIELLEGGRNPKNGYDKQLKFDSAAEEAAREGGTGTLSLRDKRAITLLIALCKQRWNTG